MPPTQETTRAPAYRPGEAGESADAELIAATLNTWNQATAEREAVTAAPDNRAIPF